MRFPPAQHSTPYKKVSVEEDSVQEDSFQEDSSQEVIFREEPVAEDLDEEDSKEEDSKEDDEEDEEEPIEIPVPSSSAAFTSTATVPAAAKDLNGGVSKPGECWINLGGVEIVLGLRDRRLEFKQRNTELVVDQAIKFTVISTFELLILF